MVRDASKAMVVVITGEVVSWIALADENLEPLAAPFS